MRKCGDGLLLNASDLIGHLNCGHLTGLELAVARGNLERPHSRDPLLELLWERGTRHEEAFVEHLRTQGFSITLIDGVEVDDLAVTRTQASMRAGDSVIVQGAFRNRGWVGRTDVLKRVETPSDLGCWSYEVIDTKLATETKGATVLQLCLYAELIASVQGLRPDYGYVVAPWSGFVPQAYRMADYAAYFRRLSSSLQTSVTAQTVAELYPEPKEYCDICRWRQRCNARRRADDHLSLVAGITKVHIEELKRRGIATLADLAEMSLPLEWRPSRGSVHSYERIREQARLQLAGRQAQKVFHELLPASEGLGLARLPAPSVGDIFLDLEGDPFAGEGGLEYLFGYVYQNADRRLETISDWAFSREEEKQVFERFMDFVVERLAVYPDLHIYHFAPYEPAAMKRLMGRYATREDAMDSLLRSNRFVDLYDVVRHGLRASVESYSIKRLEALYGFQRSMPLPEANAALARVHSGLELGELTLIDDTSRRTVATYNLDDCMSAYQLRDWLEDKRLELIDNGEQVPRPEVPQGMVSETLSEWQQKIATLIQRLTHDVPTDAALRTEEQHARWLLAHTLDWHRREQKAQWWEYFRLASLTDEDLLDERAGLAGLVFVHAIGGSPRAPVHRYTFPAQETEMRGGEDLRALGGDAIGKVDAISLDERWLDIKKRGDSIDLHPSAVFSHSVVNANVLADSLVRLGEYVTEHGLTGQGPYLAARDLLLRHPPRTGDQLTQYEADSPVESALRVALAMEGGFFPIQGPPGAGKTFTGARMICALVQAGKTVGICANSHKVIRNLIDEVARAAEDLRIQIRCMQKAADPDVEQPHLRFAKTNDELLRALNNGTHVAGGTAWVWSSADAAEAVDVLFIDEAAQMSLANVLAVSQAAPCVVLLGDPQQLDQPVQGSHPEGTDVSALHHVIGNAQTIADDRGIFLAETWRLHPEICTYTSEVFYASRLHPRPGLDIQQIRSSGPLSGFGLRYLSVPTNGNQSSSPEEAEAIARLVADVLASDTTCIDKNGAERLITLEDILIIAPYNAQVFELKERITGARIGTVDKFQGQEAPIAIYSMTTSSHTDAPRGMEFLYSLNRLNVATSRAKCLCVLVASPAVFEATCRTPRQMQLANAFCRYLELAGQN